MLFLAKRLKTSLRGVRQLADDEAIQNYGLKLDCFPPRFARGFG